MATFHCANSHLEMQLNDIVILSVKYRMITLYLIPPKMADTNISIGIGESLPRALDS